MRLHPELGAVLAIASLVGVVAQADGPRNSVERNVSAMCTKADFDGDSFRPFVCPPRCTCDLAGTLASFGSGGTCQEDPQGDFSAELISSTPPACVVFALPEPIAGGPGCTTSSLEACDCVCLNPDLNLGVCLDGWTCDDQTCSVPGESCVLDPNQTSSFPSIYGVCLDPCDDASDCPSETAPVQILGLGDGSDETVTATCSLPAQAPVPMNPNDARACVTDLETALGQACAPAP